MTILWTILIGLVAGAVAGWIMRGRSLGFIWNLVVGILGSTVGGWVYSLLGVEAGSSLWARLVCSVVGAIVILFVVGLFNKKK